MWSRLRLDIHWLDLVQGTLDLVQRKSRATIQSDLESDWSQGTNDSIACLSLRNGFDLLLQALSLPAGTEILFSAVTISDLPKIAESHGLKVVPVDVVGHDFKIDTSSLKSLISKKSKVLVIAHLFGAHPDISEIVSLAHAHGILVIEDCAQAWHTPQWRGHTNADVSLFSFGNIKTATALGGGLCRVSDKKLLRRMRELQCAQPIDRKSRFLKYLKYSLIKLISTNIGFSIFFQVCRLLNKDFEQILRVLTRGMHQQNYYSELRKQPSAGLLQMMHRRLNRYNPIRIDQRISNARLICDHLDRTIHNFEQVTLSHSYWFVPYFCSNPRDLIAHLQKNGFDVSQKGRLEVVESPDIQSKTNCPNATALLEKLVLLPCYPELTTKAIEDMCHSVLAFEDLQMIDTSHEFNHSNKDFAA